MSRGSLVSRRLAFSFVLCVALLVLGSSADGAGAVVGSLPVVKVTWSPTSLPPGGTGLVNVEARNVGDQAFAAGLTITDKLPAGVTATDAHWGAGFTDLSSECSGDGPGGPPGIVGASTVSCVLSSTDVTKYELGLAPGVSYDTDAPSPTGYLPPMEVNVTVAKGLSGTGVNTATVSGGGAVRPASDVDRIVFGSVQPGFGIVPGSFLADVFDAAYPAGAPSRQAGDHPFEFRVNFDLTSHLLAKTGSVLGGEDPFFSWPNGMLETVEATLPQGLLGNPEAVPKCSQAQFAEAGASGDGTACPSDTQVGYITPLLTAVTEGSLSRVPIYNVQPPKGVVADLAFNAGGFVQAHIYGVLDPSRNYAIKAVTPDIGSVIAVLGSEVTIWGVPGDPAHDFFRFYPSVHEGDIAGAPFGGAIRPFFTNPMDCTSERGAPVDNGGTRIGVASYAEPGVMVPNPPEEYAGHDNVTGCEDPRFRFEPNITLAPTDAHAGVPTGLEVKLRVPQRNDETANAQELYATNGFVKGISTPPIKKTVVTLPEGMTLNPSAGQGLSGCSLGQLGMSATGIPNGDAVQCPESSQIGSLVMHSPDLPVNEPLEGRVYIAKQGENPFGSLFALYLVLENAERGLLVKLAGKIELDPNTGQIKTTFDNIPQFPVSDFSLKFKAGPRAALVNPSTCGTKTIIAEYYSWQDPATAHVATSSYTIAQRPDGAPCVNNLNERPFAPSLVSGTLSNNAGWFSPFTLDLTRTDEDQEISTLSVTLPNGLLAKLTGVEQCPQANIAQAQNPARTGVEEQASPSCPAASQIGTVLVGTGTGASLAWVPGKVYFAGPYKGAPFSLVVVTPAVVGPYDLGVTVVRNALYIDPTTSQAKVLSDPFPRILKGIPVRIRDVRVSIDRPQFTFNPTSCDELAIGAHIDSANGATTALANRYQAAGCQNLAFKPKFTVSTNGKTSRRNGASLNVKLIYPKAGWGTQANIHYAKVSLPKQLPSELKTLQHACPHETFETNPAACPSESRVGTARATTPVLPVPVQGPAYFVSYGGEKFPELIMVLQGYGITIDLHGETFINEKTGITSSTLHNVPDVPVETFELTLPQGPYSALGANGNLCEAGKTILVNKRVRKRIHGRMRTITVKVKKKLPGLIMPTRFIAQNGTEIKQNTRISVTGCAKPKAKKKARKTKAGGSRRR